MSDQWRNQDGPSPADELFQAVEELKRKAQRFKGFKGGWGAFGLIGVLALALWFYVGLYIVGPGEQGVELMFGRVSQLTEPGLRWRWWPIQRYAVVDVRQIRNAEVGFRTRGVVGRGIRGQADPRPEEALMLTGDENIVQLQLFVQYVVSDPVKFLFGASDPEGILHSSAEVALRGAVGSNTIDHTMTDGRLEVQGQAHLALQELLDAYQTGLQVTEARLLAVDPPGEVQDAFHDVVRALEDRDRLIKEAEGYREDIVPKARGVAAEIFQQAEAYKAQRVIRAQGDADRFLQVLGEYKKAKKVTRDRLYLESVERIMPDVEKIILDAGNNNGVVPLLPLKELGGMTAAGGAVQAASGNSGN